MQLNVQPVPMEFAEISKHLHLLPTPRILYGDRLPLQFDYRNGMTLFYNNPVLEPTGNLQQPFTVKHQDMLYIHPPQRLPTADELARSILPRAQREEYDYYDSFNAIREGLPTSMRPPLDRTRRNDLLFVYQDRITHTCILHPSPEWVQRMDFSMPATPDNWTYLYQVLFAALQKHGQVVLPPPALI